MQWLHDFAQWLLDVLLYIPRVLFSLLLKGFAAIIQAIPVPEAVAVWAQNANALPSSIVWFLDLIQFKAGLTMVCAALLARWILRRIPGIG